jgi:uncharacterized protein YlxW (UPF0749 family)
MGLDWSPFGGNPVPGDPGQVRGLAQRFYDFVGQVRQQNGLLMDVHSGVGGVWMSPAGRAFSPHLGQLPGQLHKLHGSYADAADALDAYWPELQDAQSMATTALAKVHAAIQAQAAAQASQAQDYQAFQAHQATLEQQAKQQADQSGLPVTFTLSSYSPSPAVVAQTDQANQAYQAAMNLKDQAVQKALSAARRLSSQLDAASKAGIQNPHYGLFGFIHDAESAWDGATHWVSQHAGAIETVAAVAALGPAGLLLTSDGRALLKHAMEAMNPVFEVVSGVCGVVSFGLAIVGFIPGIGEVADALNEGVTLVKTGADAGMLIDGKLEGDSAEVSEAEGNLVGDAAGLVTGGESRLLDGVDEGLSDLDKAEQVGKEADSFQSMADSAFSKADTAEAHALSNEAKATASNLVGDTAGADQASTAASGWRALQDGSQQAGEKFQSMASKLQGKVDDLNKEVDDLSSTSGQVKQALGANALSKLTSDGGLGKTLGETREILKPAEYFGADGDRLLQGVRVTKVALSTADVAHEAPELPKNIGRMEAGLSSA